MQRTSPRAVRKEVLLAAVLEGTADAVFVKDTAGRYLLINPAGAAMLGWTVDEVVGQTDADLVPPDVARAFRESDRRALATRATRTYERTLRVRGAVRTYLMSKGLWREESGEIGGVFGLARDITERTQVEQALRKSEEELRRSRERMRVLLDAVPDQIYLLDSGGVFVDAKIDEGMRRFGSLDELRGKHFSEVLDDATAGPLQAAIEATRDGKGLQRFEYELPHTEKGTASFEARLARTQDEQTVLIARDITEQHALEAKLRHSQKIDAVGQLAGGVAHDFNNILTTILAGADMLLAKIDADHLHYETLRQIRKAGEHAAVLTHQLLAFSRKQVFNPKSMSLNNLVLDAEAMLRRLIEEDIELTTRCAHDLGAVEVDFDQIKQVLINLVINARDAMPSGGQITIETSNVDLGGAEDCGQDSEAVSGQYVRFSVTDNGTGMSPQTLEHLFEPFFTTKEPSKGTGLGLATSYEIVRQHGGTIAVESEVGVGTAIHVSLPRTRGTAPEPSAGEVPAPLGGDETILLVEDDERVRRMVTTLLAQLGYNVMAAANGVEAIDLARDVGTTIDLLLSDVVMPGLSGREVALEVSRLRPGIKVLLSSGYTDDATLRAHLDSEGWSFLSKPFRRAQLARRVRELLDETRCDMTPFNGR